jgi:4-amino-4-deoxy-L-arabinose transferase-like glycosyltransferase
MTNETFIKIKHIENDVQKNHWSWWHIGAGLGLIGGFLAIFLACVLTVLIWIFQPQSLKISLQSIINFLFYLAIPTLFWGAHCLDKIKENTKNKD